MRIVMIFLDGVGLGACDPAVNPLAAEGVTPRLAGLMGRKLVAASFPWRNELGGGAAVDAVLDVPGLPQSATGQVTLLTGVNAQAVLGRHQNGFPGRVLRRILAEHSIFRRLRLRGRRATFANAFTAEYFAAVAAGRWRHSATTLAAMAGGVELRFLPELRAGRAVYQDITRADLRERGYDLPPAAPAEAARHLHAAADGFAFTLFEYFQTDLAGHAGDAAQAAAKLGAVDEFIHSVLAWLDPRGDLLLVASDHGNIEDLRIRSHTANAVPILAFGAGAGDFLAGLTRLDEIAPRILGMLV